MLDTLILIGRPAAGKSEIIDYIGSLGEEERRKRLDMGPIEVMDDFPFLWEKFEEDRILVEHGRKRLWTDDDLYFTDEFFWILMIEKINLAYRKALARDPGGFGRTTKIIEFARGGTEGYVRSLGALCGEIVERASILYVKVPYEESERRNRRRARPGMEDSILHHSLPDEKMRHYYLVDDWDAMTSGREEGRIEVGGRSVRFVNFTNEPELTDDPAKLAPALEKAVRSLREE